MPGGETETGAGEPNEGGLMAEAPDGCAVRHSAGRAAHLEGKRAKGKKIARTPRLPVGICMAMAGMGLMAVSGCRPSGAANRFQDLGAGVSNVTGLRGSLKTRWMGNAVQYQLEMEPIDLLDRTGFDFVIANPPGPLVLHMKLMDSTGYVVCGKDVLFPNDGQAPGQADGKQGQDVMQTAVGDDGKADSLSAQGTLPCTPQQYKQVDYWDFTTNFPTLSEQDELGMRARQLKARQKAEEEKAREQQKRGPGDFYLVGDDQAAGYDASHTVLRTQLNRTFLVGGQGQQATASAWAGNGTLFRYKCDPHSRCVLTGGGRSLSVTELE